jgi:hypothetical protein
LRLSGFHGVFALTIMGWRGLAKKPIEKEKNRDKENNGAKYRHILFIN